MEFYHSICRDAHNHVINLHVSIVKGHYLHNSTVWHSQNEPSVHLEAPPMSFIPVKPWKWITSSNIVFTVKSLILKAFIMSYTLMFAICHRIQADRLVFDFMGFYGKEACCTWYTFVTNARNVKSSPLTLHVAQISLSFPHPVISLKQICCIAVLRPWVSR